MKVYLDNAASTPLDPAVFEEMKPYLLELYGNPSSIHSHGRVLRSAIESARKRIAACIGAGASEVFFTSGGTEADNMVMRGAVEKYGVKRIISTQLEHHAVSHSIEELAKVGKIEAVWLSVDAEGNISLSELEAELAKEGKALVSLMHGNNEIGTITDIRAVGELCEQYGALFHSDTVQTMGNEPIDVREIKVHFLNAAAHKFYGPKGTGFIFTRSGYNLPPLIHGGSQERNMRAGTENVAGIVGMAYALEQACAHLAEKKAYLLELKNYFKQALTEKIPNIAFNGVQDPEKSLATVLNVAFPGNNEMLVYSLDIAGISVSAGSACTSGSNTGSHVLVNLGHNAQRCTNSLRFSFGTQNTKEELDYVVEKLLEVLG